ncbi:ABC transporter permease [Desulfosporosinus sp. BICA1-9]|uniref:ABC transporter permease n=1 Tax=Desulfosporosinus sp. BICA1-9 TaxID=1531958 RepID=UPI00054B8D8E|nr:ABC transporter permease [Desulfosporosinus sp. BICA1-9]KJS47489.1 MAG: peptide ABC transporter permease [Peptococcaceae bacterium BRH_c23]KJS84532.1 MAG: peptide ABC transporter permease [Desulfosporosinus sp. BICA1-9]HBW37552.1 ABC transporter permease [Desulfosporosinus sp.]
MSQIESKYKKKSQVGEIWRRLKKNRAAMVGLVILSIFALSAIFADVLANYDKMVIAQNVRERLLPPSSHHLFGTDEYGRDVFARIVHGARVSLTIGLSTVSISILIGGIIGSMAGFYGGIIDTIIMRIMDTMQAIPPILLALALVSALGPGMTNLLIAITVATFPGYTRIIRSVILPVVGQEFVEAARACGTGDRRIILRHILPNAIGPIIVQSTMAVAQLIIATAALSFIGMGIQPPKPEWGAMLAGSREYMRTSPYLVIFPGLAIVLAALSLNLLGDGLRDALDPRLKN